MRPRDALDWWVLAITGATAVVLLVGPWTSDRATAVLWASTEVLIGSAALYLGRRLPPLPDDRRFRDETPARPLPEPRTPPDDANSTGGPPW